MTKVLETFVLVDWAGVLCDSVTYTISEILLQINEKPQKSHNSESMKINMKLLLSPYLAPNTQRVDVVKLYL